MTRARRRAKSQIVEIGSSVDFHGGIHASLLNDPPAGTRYRVCTPAHVFLRDCASEASRARLFRASRDFALAEMIDPGAGRALFHSVRWPVLNRSSWVVDLDDLGYPALWGRSAINLRQRRQFERDRSGQTQRAMHERATRMLTAYTHPSCKAILVMTEHAVAEAYQWLRAVTTPQVIRALLRRCHIVPGAHRTLDHAEVRRKWREDPLTVVFCGRDYYQKNGRVALAVMTSLAKRYPAVRFQYIGEAPRDSLTRAFSVLPNTAFHGSVPRGAALGTMAASHILFHPARYESFGMVYAESMAAGLAVVTSAGPGMAHVDEILGEEGALQVRCDGEDLARDRKTFERALGHLLSSRETAAAMAAANYRCATSGVLSLRHRNGLLQSIYRQAVQAPAEPLRIEDLLGTGRLTRTARLTSAALLDDLAEFRRVSPRAATSALLRTPLLRKSGRGERI